MTKKRLALFGGLLVLSFAASCGVFFLLGSKPAPQAAGGGQPAATTQPMQGVLSLAPSIGELEQLNPVEQQLTELLRELRSKLAECRQKQRELAEQEKRVHMTRELLKKQAQDLEDLRIRLVGPLASLKKAKAVLDQTRIAIDQQERANLKRTATIYEKMDPGSSSGIFKEMCSNKQEDDAAKILYYMSEKSAARLLGEMPDKALAAKLSEKLKRIKEQG